MNAESPIENGCEFAEGYAANQRRKSHRRPTSPARADRSPLLTPMPAAREIPANNTSTASLEDSAPSTGGRSVEKSERKGRTISANQKRQHLIVVRLADVKPEPVVWLWERRIARGKLTLLVGDPGVCKSFVSLYIAARVSTGREWPDGAPGCAPGPVILLSAEDGLADTIRPRLEALEANLNRISSIKGIKTKTGEIPFDLESSMVQAEELVQKVRPALIVVDPVSAYMGSTNTHRDADVRRVLSPLVALAEKYEVAIIGIMHMNKSEAAAIYRATGSIAFIALARIALVVARDKQHPDWRILASLKNNLATPASSLAFRVEGDGSGATLRCRKQPVQVDVSDLLSLDAPAPRRRGGTRRKASALLKEMLGGGRQLPVDEIKARAKELDIGYSTLQRAYRELGGSDAQRRGFAGKVVWSLS